MKIFPAIDLFDKKAVRLYKGDYDKMTVYEGTPYEVAKSYGVEMKNVLEIILTVLLAIDSVALIVVVLLQESKSDGLSALSGSSVTFWGQNKGRSMEGTLDKVTKILAALFIVLAIVLNLGVFA